MPDLRVQVDGLDAVTRDLDAAAHDLDDLTDTYRAIGDEYARVAEANTPSDTGRLRRGWKGVARPDRSTATNAEHYAGPVLRGAPRRGIKPAPTIPRTDAIMADRAPDMLADAIDTITRRHDLT